MRRSTVWMACLFGLLILLADQVALAQQVLFLPQDRQTAGRRVRGAFKESAAEAGQWTVELTRNRKELALGLIVSSKGEILTKLSQVQPPVSTSQLASTTGESASRLMCRLPGGKLVEATMIASDPETDLALLKVEADGLKAAEFEQGFKPELGRWVVTPSTGGFVKMIGIVSAQPRSIPAAKVFGVLGVQLDQVGGTARILEVLEDSGAKAAGLKPGDLVVRCDDKEITGSGSLQYQIRQRKPGEEVTLRILRDDKPETVKVTLTHPFGDFLSQFALQNRMGTDISKRADDYPEVFSHDGDVRPEECGGPLLDLDGKVIGINIARAGRTETLALPVSVVEKALERLRDQLPESRPINVSTEVKMD
ncbi:MAG TPA: PDZ domain-containing protein [Caulifigura sp.]|nr:PDZ domain-containing protein [Caulifigura sp.]